MPRNPTPHRRSSPSTVRSSRKPAHPGRARRRTSTGHEDLRELEAGLDRLQSDAAPQAPDRPEPRAPAPRPPWWSLILVWQLYVVVRLKPRATWCPARSTCSARSATLGATAGCRKPSRRRSSAASSASSSRWPSAPRSGCCWPRCAAAPRDRTDHLGPAGAAVGRLGARRHHLVRPDRRHGLLRGAHGRHPVDRERPHLRRRPGPAAVPPAWARCSAPAGCRSPPHHPARRPARLPRAASSRAGRSRGARSWPPRSSPSAAPSASASARCCTRAATCPTWRA